MYFLYVSRSRNFFWQCFHGFYPFRNRFFLNPWVQLEFFRNCGSISKIVAPAFEMMMNSRVAWLKQIVISRWVIWREQRFSEIAAPFQKLWLHFKNCGSCIWNDDEQPRCFGKANSHFRMSRNFCKTRAGPRGWEKNCFWRGKTHRISPQKFLRPRDTYKKYILQKNWVKTVIPAFSSGQSNLPPSIWGPSRQLDDQHRNTNMNNKDHLVGQLTNSLIAGALLVTE